MSKKKNEMRPKEEIKPHIYKFDIKMLSYQIAAFTDTPAKVSKEVRYSCKHRSITTFLTPSYAFVNGDPLLLSETTNHQK